VDTEDKLILGGVAVIIAIYLYKSIKDDVTTGLFGEHVPITHETQSNAFQRHEDNSGGSVTYTESDTKSFLRVGNTTYGIAHKDQTDRNMQFIDRKIAWGDAFGLTRFDWYNKWVYS